MRYGDISNRGGIKLAFRLEDTLLKKQNESVVSNFARKFDRMYGYDVDSKVMSVLQRLYLKTDYNLVIVINENNKDKKAVKDVLSRIPFCSEVYVHNQRTSEISSKLLSKEWEYYVDDNDIRRAGITSSASVSLKDFLETCLKV